MSAVYRSGNFRWESKVGSEDHPWEPTPKWHWRYWFGYRWRQWVDDGPVDDGPWDHGFYQHYKTDYQRAMQALEEQCQ